ncbi:AAA family ATPase [Coleofasciculus sp. FACHB-T130]|uniref:AAA family ATPase n=1 Tax=Cyanophyceae TaxID=3028117 RepID=UPI0016893913|nr:AAA family ATPase [Coleofasciculus sp. FACHB-T130]MBD1880741.1 AAA family ATPase [Coleofasciculus sp. FACHB-T130]
MITVEITPGNPGSNEYQAAKTLKAIFERDIEPSRNGRILIAPNLTLYGQETKDIDIMVFNQFSTFPCTLNSKGKQGRKITDYSKKIVNIKNFCFVIEVKDHPIEKISFEALRSLVLYKNKWHDATNQNEQQKYSLLNFFKDKIGWSPYICNFIWFRNINLVDLPNYPHNVLHSTPTFIQILELACEQCFPYFYPGDGGGYWDISCTRIKSSEIFDGLDEVFSVFEKAKKGIGKLTKSRLDNITKIEILKNQKYANAIGKRLVVLRGRAGTGKTVKLLHISYNLYVKNEQRCLILTYNKALVSDLKRMIALAHVSDDIAAPTIAVRTVHSFMRSLMIGFGIDIHEQEDGYFIEHYDDLKQKMLSYIKKGLLNTNDIQRLMKKKHDEVAWDKVLIDECQDWPEDEKEILFTIFETKNFIIADGIDQLIRSTNRTDWLTGVDHHPIVPQKRSLRQTANLCRFEKHYAAQVGLTWDLEPKDDLLGGKIIITSEEYNPSLHQRLLDECEESGNKPYEMLFLVPPSLVDKTYSDEGKVTNSSFKLSPKWNEWGIKLWDGTHSGNRSDYPKEVEEIRVLPYDSCRGLEGWTVVCLGMDEFFEYKKSKLNNFEEEQLSLNLNNSQKVREEPAYRWCMIPFTRAIDTLVITIKNPQSEYALILRNLAAKCPDFIEWIE